MYLKLHACFIRPDVSVTDVETVAVCINLYFLFDDSGLALLHNPFQCRKKPSNHTNRDKQSHVLAPVTRSAFGCRQVIKCIFNAEATAFCMISHTLHKTF